MVMGRVVIEVVVLVQVVVVVVVIVVVAGTNVMIAMTAASEMIVPKIRLENVEKGVVQNEGTTVIIHVLDTRSAKKASGIPEQANEQLANIVKDHAFAMHSHPTIPSLAFSSFPPSRRQPANKKRSIDPYQRCSALLRVQATTMTTGKSKIELDLEHTGVHPLTALPVDIRCRPPCFSEWERAYGIRSNLQTIEDRTMCRLQGAPQEVLEGMVE